MKNKERSAKPWKRVVKQTRKKKMKAANKILGRSSTI